LPKSPGNAVSRNKFLLINKVGSDEMPEFMKKLNLRKIRWIIRERGKGEIPAHQMAKIQGWSRFLKDKKGAPTRGAVQNA